MIITTPQIIDSVAWEGELVAPEAMKGVEVAPALRTKLVAAAERGDTAACNVAAFDLYGLSSDERAAIGGDGG